VSNYALEGAKLRRLCDKARAQGNEKKKKRNTRKRLPS